MISLSRRWVFLQEMASESVLLFLFLFYFASAYVNISVSPVHNHDLETLSSLRTWSFFLPCYLVKLLSWRFWSQSTMNSILSSNDKGSSRFCLRRFTAKEIINSVLSATSLKPCNLIFSLPSWSICLFQTAVVAPEAHMWIYPFNSMICF